MIELWRTAAENKIWIERWDTAHTHIHLIAGEHRSELATTLWQCKIQFLFISLRNLLRFLCGRCCYCCRWVHTAPSRIHTFIHIHTMAIYSSEAHTHTLSSTTRGLEPNNSIARTHRHISNKVFVSFFSFSSSTHSTAVFTHRNRRM